MTAPDTNLPRVWTGSAYVDGPPTPGYTPSPAVTAQQLSDAIAAAPYVPRRSTAPDPAVSPAWLDTSTTPPALKVWNGTAWVALGGGGGTTVTAADGGDFVTLVVG